MCGIGGWFGDPADADPSYLLEALRHRGPDGEGIWQSAAATLVHTRLAILELSPAGEQPMTFSEGPDLVGHRQTVRRCILAFNGEIYNHEELRLALEAQGEQFNGHSDTEVLLRLLIREGARALPMLAGMFAFAFWDELAGKGLLARDSFGIKPLYYRDDEAALTFASESQPLTRPDDPPDPTALRDFFLWGSMSACATLRMPVRQLAAGHLLEWQAGRHEIHRWYRPSIIKHDATNAVARTRAALEETIRRHLVSDVPVGIFLSGGIDSTALLALARAELGPTAEIRTFSIGFNDPLFDESACARRTAAHFGAVHTEWKMTAEEGLAEIPEFLAAVDQPSIDGFNTWCVSRLAHREGMKVVLSGVGGDEWFSGYKSFQRVPQFHRAYRLLGWLRPLAACLLEAQPSGSPWRRLGGFLRSNGSWLAAFHAQRGIFTLGEANQLAKQLTGQQPTLQPWDLADFPWLHPLEPTEMVSWLELSCYMRNQLLRDGDSFSMAHGLELRVPLVDIRLAETLMSLPAGLRLQPGKQHLLDAVPEVPEWVRNRPKQGFRFPFQQWMEGNFGELLTTAAKQSSVPLNTWYRTWAVALVQRRLSDRN
jgi:asparagine synthase (glutamine-hydrolysing)